MRGDASHLKVKFEPIIVHLTWGLKQVSSRLNRDVFTYIDFFNDFPPELWSKSVAGVVEDGKNSRLLMISLDKLPGSGTGIGLAAIAMGTTRRRVSKAVSFRIDCSIVKLGCGSLAAQLKFGVTLQSIKRKDKKYTSGFRFVWRYIINQSMTMSNLNFSKGKNGEL